ncbi:uncharacterized protein LOC108696313 [Xenopus laevis]|uniref:Uncharacterized protein LOC108696313 n=2 Tax=Xenopus laevis TaxID=8355 RepID=A0A8J1L8U6_XENLA|nr:uncharacterized protein LOC108696313 [Xenopus laevis]
MSVSTTHMGNLCITTQVLPGTDVDAAHASVAKKTQAHFRRHKNLHMKALGTVLILIGLLQQSFGVIMNIAEEELYSLTVRSGVYFWGGLVVILAGCITVALETTENIILVKASLGFIAVNAVLGAVGLILYMVQLYLETELSWIRRNYEVASYCNNVTNQDKYDYFYYERNEVDVLVLRLAVNSVVLLLSLTAFLLSISVIILGRKVLKDNQYLMLK